MRMSPATFHSKLVERRGLPGAVITIHCSKEQANEVRNSQANAETRNLLPAYQFERTGPG